MNESYAEVVVKRKETAKTLVIRVLLVIAAVISFFLSVTNTFLLLLSAVFIVGIIYLFPRLSLEYEYVYCDGQLDFDKIMGKASRKNALKIDFENVVVMAPNKSHALDGYAHLQTKVKDFTSKNHNDKFYVLVVKAGENTNKIYFEPNEKMIDMIRNKYPRKVNLY